MSEQLSLFPAASDNQPPSLANNDSDAKRKAIQRFLNNGKDSPIAHVNTYSPSRRQTKYYRLSFRVDTRMKHIHIPGGSIKAKLAQYRARELMTMIDRGAELPELLAAIQDWRK